MARWLLLLGPLIVWLAHFIGVYAIASLADTVARADDFGWRMVSLGFSGVCLAGVIALLALAMRRALFGSQDAGPLFLAQISALSAGLAAIAIIWQATPNLIGY